MQTQSDPQPLVAQSHSGLGITSFVLSLVALAGYTIYFIVVQFVDTAEYSDLLMYLMFLMLFIALVGVGFGIAAVCQKDRKKLFGVLGLIFSIILFVVPVVIALVIWLV